jgi:nitrile hydratase
MAALTSEIVPGLIAGGASCRMDADVAPTYSVGDKVRAMNINPAGHTRLPRYARGKVGTVTRDQGVFSFPDTSVSGVHSDPQHVYSVRFESEELWGADANANSSLHIDMFENYLEPA